MRSLVTGGAGFIGSHLVEHLLAAGDEVVVLDDLSTGSLSNLRASRKHPGLEVVIGSILDPVAVGDAVSRTDRVFHLAAAVGVKLIVEHPLQSLRTNVHGTENLLMACTERGVPLLLVSTSEVYGKNTSDRLDEDADRILGSPLTSRWTYAAAKGIDESFAKAYHDEQGLAVTIVRLFNTVGPRQKGRYGMVVPNLVGQALRGEPLTVFGDGRQTRCFSAVGDIVPAIVRLAEAPAAVGRAFNLGGKREIAILQLASLVLEVTGSSSGIRLVPYSEAYAAGYEDMRRRVPDNARARELIGFDPTTSIEDIVRGVALGLMSSVDEADWVMRPVGVELPVAS
jgi:UDP-glucose 4-epimerase